MPTIQILYKGTDDITADIEFSTAEFVCYAGGTPGTCDLRVKDDTHKYAVDYFHAGGTLELYVDGVRQWDGWAINVSREWAFPVDITTNPGLTPRYWHIEGYDRNFLMLRRFCYDLADPMNTDFGTYPAGAYDDDVVKDMLANYVDLQDDGLDLVSGITRVGPIDPFEPIKVVQPAQSWADAMRLIGTMNGALSYVDPDRVVRYVDDITDTAPFALSDEPDAGSVGYRELKIRFDATNLFNEAFVRGVGVGNSSAVIGHTIDEASIAEHGLLQFAELYEGMYETLSVQRRADTFIYGSPSHLRGHRDDLVRIECSVFEPGLRAGMGVSFHSGVWDFGELNYSPTDLVPGTFDKNTEFERMLVSIGKIESNNTYTRQNKRSFAYGRWQIMPANWRVWGPLALGLPRSFGIASRDIDPSGWFPPPTPQNQDIVARWRFSQLYNNKGHDPRRVAASWRSGPSVGSREPNTWSRGTILYVNHACVPLGYAPVTPSTVLDSVTNPTQDTTDIYQAVQNVDDVYPIRKMAMRFPTPSSIRFDLMMSHEYDTAWSYQDPIPTPTPPPGPGPGGPYSELIYVPGDTTGTTGPTPPPPSPIPNIPDNAPTFFLANSGGRRRGTTYGEEKGGGAIYSSVGIQHGTGSNVPWYKTNCGIGVGGWNEVEDSEGWYGVPTGKGIYGFDQFGHPILQLSLSDINQFYDLEVRFIGDGSVISGYCPQLSIRVASTPPAQGHYGDGQTVGSIAIPGGNGVGERSVANADATGIIPAGSLYDGCYIVISPDWQANGPGPDGYWCDSSYVLSWGTSAYTNPCNAKGPRCTGQGSSGVFLLVGGGLLTATPIGWSKEGFFSSAWQDTPATTVQNGPASYGTTTDPQGVYRTTYPYIAGTLKVSWQGTKLSAGTEFQEVDPSLGTFKISDLINGEGWLSVTYMPPAGAQPTDPLPGEPGASGSSQWAEDVIARAFAMIGVPYKLGAESTTQTDCSGLVFRCFMDSGHGTLIDYRRLLAAGYAHFFANQGHFTTNFSYARRGDLICYGTAGNISHIAIYLGDGTIISALTTTGVTRTRVFGLREPNGSPLPFYGVCLVPYPEVTVRTTSDPAPGTDTAPEDPISSTDNLPTTENISSGKVYRPRALSQYGWGTQYDGVNSMMTAAAMALERQSLGNYSDINGSPKSTPVTMRSHSDIATLMVEGNFSNIAYAWSHGWSQTLYNPGTITWEEFVSFVRDDRRGALLNGIETAFPVEYQTKPYSGVHTIYVNEVMSDGSFLIFDPYGSASRIVPQEALQAFAQSIHNGNAVEAAFTRITPEIP